jgi:SAM-dependent methyltransferase
MSLVARLHRAVTFARWDHPQRILVDGFVARVAREIPRHARILDAGAGESIYAQAFAHCRYVACDRTVGDAAWDYSRLDVVGDLAALPFGREAFDAILCTNALEHVREPAVVLSEMAAILKRGGRLYVSVPFLGDPIHQEPYDFFRYTPYGLRYLVEKAGLTPVSVTPMGGVFYLFSCFLWWYAIVYRRSVQDRVARTGILRRAAERILGTAMLLLARFSTMLVMTLGHTETAARHFTNGYAVVAEKPRVGAEACTSRA